MRSKVMLEALGRSMILRKHVSIIGFIFILSIQALIFGIGVTSVLPNEQPISSSWVE